MNPSSESSGESTSEPTPSGGVSRRRLVSAGLTATPVLAALKSNTVLAGGGGGHSCVRPSSFSSLTAAHMKVSRGREIRDDYTCHSHGYWRNNSGNLPHDFKKKTKFLSDKTGFTANPNGFYSDKSLQNVLELGGGSGANHNYAALARHVTAAWLSAHSVGNDPDRVLLTKQQCAALWNGLASGGTWSPFGGAHWTLQQTMDYFDVIFGPSFI